MKIIEKYTGGKTYMFPNGDIATPDKVLEQFPAALAFAHIIETDDSGEVMFAVQNLAAMKSLHGIPKETSENESIALLQEIVNAPPPIPEESTPEQRIAAALEAQVLLAMPITNTDDPDLL